MRITERINHGVMLDQTLEFLYQEMKGVIPYNRIGVSSRPIGHAAPCSPDGLDPIVRRR